MSANPPDRLEVQLINALARLGDEEALLAQEELLRHPDEDVRKAQISVVVRQRRERGQDTLDVFRQALRDGNHEVREEALELARELGDERLIPLVAPLLVDRSEDIRWLAMDFIRSRRCRDASLLEPVLSLILDNNQDIRGRVLALRALAYPHDQPRVREVLLEALEEPSYPIRMGAGEVLARMDFDPDTMQALMEKASSDEGGEDIQLSALWALARTGRPEVVPLLVSMLDHANPDFWEAAVFGLGIARAQEHRQRLLAMWRQAGARVGRAGPPGKGR
ncbi:MAG TPA: HEAT repeat domain-containing protein [Candidatus Nitrosotenuis sp.]|nr:HEAT repeat domain-containing protein [Candidatus Nitrosotenuis sp.]